MAYTFKDFASDCYTSGVRAAAWITPPFAQGVIVPFLGAALGVLVMPLLLGTTIGVDYLNKKIELWKRPKQTPAEKKIRETFGDIELKGYPHYGGGITMKLLEANTYTVPHAGGFYAEADMFRMQTHHNREKCAENMLGSLAECAAGNGRSKLDTEDRFIVVRKKGELSSQFFQSAKINKPSDAPSGAIVAKHHYYEGPIGKGAVQSETYYAITPVDTTTAERLRKLGL